MHEKLRQYFKNRTIIDMPPLEKVTRVVNYQPDFLARLSNKIAASYLGLAPSILGRIKSKL